MSAALTEESWQLKAACRGPHATVFFPPSHGERREARQSREQAAKSICHSCPVCTACREYALEIREPHGIWGGLNELERKSALEQRLTVRRPSLR